MLPGDHPQWCLHIEFYDSPWWRHQMETFSALLAICPGISPISGEFPTQRPVTRSFDVFFDLHLNKRLNKQSWCWWFETLSHPLWRNCNATECTQHVQLKQGPYPQMNLYLFCIVQLIESRNVMERHGLDLSQKAQFNTKMHDLWLNVLTSIHQLSLSLANTLPSLLKLFSTFDLNIFF